MRCKYAEVFNLGFDRDRKSIGPSAKVQNFSLFGKSWLAQVSLSTEFHSFTNR
ncbi:MAG: hypothetical protein WBA89_28240 [Microcoleus sp.]|uniref:hypothetical protein n=1 Tax=Microcoleus sp. TaxID=44472 RepID=UPI003C715AFD